MPTVRYEHVYKCFSDDAPPAVNDFNLEIPDKEFLVLVGPSGCGDCAYQSHMHATAQRQLSGG